jgi:hypothetical protein
VSLGASSLGDAIFLSRKLHLMLKAFAHLSHLILGTQEDLATSDAKVRKEIPNTVVKTDCM